jgi:aldose 1-epimerase
MASADTPVPPSGAQHEIRYGEQAVTVVEVGGGVRTFTAGGEHVLDGYERDAMCDGARGQTLVPWPNRVQDGRYEFAGERLQLPLTEPDQGNAIHGLVRWRPWSIAEHADDRVSLTCRLHPQAGYPFALDLRNDYRLDADGLTVTTVATNIGTRPCPYGIGFHPYLRVGLDHIDDAVLHLPGATYLPTDDRGIPVRRSPVEGGDYDFRTPRPLSRTQIDTTFTDLQLDADGRCAVTLRAPDGGRAVALWVDASFPYVEIFTGDTLPDEAKRRRGLGVEPMTCPPNALQTGTDVIVIEPGGRTTTRWGVRVDGF